VNLWGFQHEEGSWFEVHPEDRFFSGVSEIVFRSTERVNLSCLPHKEGGWFEVHPEHRRFSGSPGCPCAHVAQVTASRS
jgi:hypothetical protein